jgi:hypothetical protein
MKQEADNGDTVATNSMKIFILNNVMEFKRLLRCICAHMNLYWDLLMTDLKKVHFLLV